jgi:hypothetical protein
LLPLRAVVSRLVRVAEQEEALPGAENAVVPEDKLRAYLLNPDHSTGTHKCRVFMSALEVGPSDWEYMRDQLQTAVRAAKVTNTRPSHGCTLYEVPVQIQGRNGEEKRVLSVWKIPDGGGETTLVTAYLAENAK